MAFGRFDFMLSFVSIRYVNFDKLRIGMEGFSSVREEDITPVDPGYGLS